MITFIMIFAKQPSLNNHLHLNFMNNLFAYHN